MKPKSTSAKSSHRKKPTLYARMPVCPGCGATRFKTRSSRPNAGGRIAYCVCLECREECTIIWLAQGADSLSGTTREG